jgi:hypothetical protein
MLALLLFMLGCLGWLVGFLARSCGRNFPTTASPCLSPAKRRTAQYGTVGLELRQDVAADASPCGGRPPLSLSWVQSTRSRWAGTRAACDSTPGAWWKVARTLRASPICCLCSFPCAALCRVPPVFGATPKRANPPCAWGDSGERGPQRFPSSSPSAFCPRHGAPALHHPHGKVCLQLPLAASSPLLKAKVMVRSGSTRCIARKESRPWA